MVHVQHQPSADDQAASEGSTSQARSLFFNSIWLWGSGLLILLGAALSERSLALLGLLTLVTAGGAWLWARFALNHIAYTRTLATDRIFPGEQVAMRVSLVNRKLLPLAWLDIEDQIPDRLRIVEQEVIPSGIPGMETLRITTAMRWYERVSWRFHVECPVRGYFTLGPVGLRSGDLFGFFNAREDLESYASIIVYPRVVPLDEIGIPPRHLFGDLRIRRQIITDPSRAVGVREYRPEDSFRYVHWKATARTQELQTKVFEPTTAVQFGVFLNLDTFEHYWEGIDYQRAENAITVAASLAIHALDTRHTVGMYANGVVGGSDQPLRVRPSRSPEQAHLVLSGLAKLSPIASLNFPRLLRTETLRFPWGSTIVVVTALMSDPLAAAMAELARAGHRLVLVTIDEIATPPIRGLLTFKIDSDQVAGPRPPRRRYARQLHPIHHPVTAAVVERD
ncbi:MAG TPA: DUF58 domain-containing protein [Thermomicrobiales bacterium]|nr:DUF58 domain-containing protein [Thermomicrobiales bacterium]